MGQVHILNMVILLRGNGCTNLCADGMRQHPRRLCAPCAKKIGDFPLANCRTPACGSVICDGLSSRWRTDLFSKPFLVFVRSHICDISVRRIGSGGDDVGMTGENGGTVCVCCCERMR